MKSIQIKTAIPGPKSIRMMAERKKYVPQGPFHVTPIFVAKAEGALLTDVDGNQYIDFTGGLGTLNTGHRPPEVVKAIKSQSDRFLHTCFHITPYDSYTHLAKALQNLTPGKFAKKTLFVNSGAEAVENAVKIARYHTKRQAIVCFEHGFHGRTLLALTLTSKVKPYKYGFGPFAPEVYRLPYPYVYRRSPEVTGEEFVDALLHQIKDFFKSQVDPGQVAAVIMELVTGEGGFIPAPKKYVQGLAKICRDNGILFIADEVQTGFARTGKTFASEHYDLQPDLITMAKSLGGGLPLGAVTGRAEIMDSVHVGGLGGTYGGNPLACAAALASIDVMRRKKLAQRSRVMGEKIRRRFEQFHRKYDIVGDARGLGSMRAIELVRDRRTKEPAPEKTAELVKRCYESGLLVLSAGVFSNVIRTLMPLVISDSELNEGLDVLEQNLSIL